MIIDFQDYDGEPVDIDLRPFEGADVIIGNRNGMFVDYVAKPGISIRTEQLPDDRELTDEEDEKLLGDGDIFVGYTGDADEADYEYFVGKPGISVAVFDFGDVLPAELQDTGSVMEALDAIAAGVFR